MSLYNMLMSRNPAGPYLLALLNINQETAEQYLHLGRLRDVWINAEGTEISVLHRNYGDEGQPVNDAVAKHPNFLRLDPTSDSTYWVYKFSVPAELHEIGKKFAAHTDTSDRWAAYVQLIEDMKSGVKNELTEKAFKVGEVIVGQIAQAVDGTLPGRHVVSNEDGSVTIDTFGATNSITDEDKPSG